MISVRSLPRICVALGADQPERLEALVLDACDRGEEFLEIRLDLLFRPEEGLQAIERALRRRPGVKILATCRRQEAQGGFAGSIERQEEILAAAVSCGAQLADVEIETAEKAPDAAARLRESARIVVSWHDFERTPPLERVLQRLQKIEADIYKLAVTALKPSDNLRLLSLFQSPGHPPLVALAMGEVGAPSRILSPSRGAAFTFASPDGATGTAPGQFPASAMRQVYRAHLRKPETKVYGVIADPVGHSLSPVLHNRAFKARRIDAVYLPFLVQAARLTDFFTLAAELPVQGFSVTIPHKQRVLRRLHGVERLARRIGAVNTVFRKQGKLWGTNTDAQGVSAPLEKRTRLSGTPVLVAGTGGAARAAIFALGDKGAKVTVAGRNSENARKLARACGVASLPWEEAVRRSYGILVQATPVGMAPHVEDNLFPGGIPAEIVFDMVYNPLETALLRRAKELGKETVPGLEMFLEQAAAQFELWTGENAPRLVMRDAVLEALGAREA